MGNDVNVVEDYGWDSPERTGHTEYTTSKIMELLRQVKAHRVMDLGSGNGSLCNDLINSGFEAVGVEYDAKGVEIARQNYPGIRFYKKGVQEDPQELLAEEDGEKFDAVVSAEVVEHLFSPHLLPIFAREVLKDGGHLLVTTPYHGYLKNLALSVADKWDFHHSALVDGSHIKFFSKSTIPQLLSENGFRVTSFNGTGRLPYLSKSMILLSQKNS